MWGSTFSDLAKKAQELQEQAEAVASTSSWSAPTSLFNLDAMQQGEDEATLKPKDNENVPVMTATKPQQRLNLHPGVVREPVMASPARGKLKVPEAKPKTPVKETTVAVKKMAPPQAPNLAEENVEEEGNGWDDDDDMGGIESADSQEEAAATNQVKPRDVAVEDLMPIDETSGEGKSARLPAQDVQSMPVTETMNESLSKDENLNGGHVPKSQSIANSSSTRETNVPFSETAETEQTLKSDHSQNSSEGTNGKAVASLEEDEVVIMSPQQQNNEDKDGTGSERDAQKPESDAVQQTSLESCSAISVDEHELMKEVDTVKEESSHAASEEKSTHAAFGADVKDGTSEAIALEEHEREHHPAVPPEVPEKCPTSECVGEGLKSKVLVLCSNHSLNRNAHKRQQFIYTVLNSKGVKYETIDGSDPVKKDWRDQLFKLSGIREYPQIFLLDMSDGQTSFWGTFEHFEHANDNYMLVKELEGTGASASHEDQLERSTTAHAQEIDTEIPESTDPVAVSEMQVPEEVMEQFSQQLKRLEENYQAERSDMEERHAREMQKAVDSLNHDVCESQRRELEVTLSTKIQEKEEQLLELMQANEGYKLKLDVLKREVAGTQELLEARDKDMGKVNESHSQDLKTLEQKLLDTEAKAGNYREEIQQLTQALEQSRSDLSANKQEHADLKARVKVVATELKDRRVECRELRAKVDELTESNEKLKHEVEQLNLQLFSQDRSRSAKDGEMEQLRAKLVEAAAALEQAEKGASDRQAKGEKALAEYKKKAQNSLSLANARTAAAVQAKEEAELEARAARSTADSAMERAVRAEMASKQSIAEAKVYVNEMESERDRLKAQVATTIDELRRSQEQLSEAQEQHRDTIRSRDRLSEELKDALTKMEAEQEKASSFQEDLRQSQNRTNELRDDIATLREQLRRSEEAANSSNNETAFDKTSTKAAAADSSNLITHTSSEDATVVSLRQELQDANEAIDELKEALKNVVENSETNNTETTNTHTLGPSGRPNEPITDGGSDSTPLFFAMEKQAELRTARNEINRLANLLADVQSEKMEAFESMQEMRKRMEEAESRLKRFKKLGNVCSNGQQENGSASSAGPYLNGHQSTNSSTVNIEYLKNIMMRYLNAKNISERKALVPVIGAVLCLTEEEQKEAMQSLEESASLSHSLFESLSGKLTSK